MWSLNNLFYVCNFFFQTLAKDISKTIFKIDILLHMRKYIVIFVIWQTNLRKKIYPTIWGKILFLTLYDEEYFKTFYYSSFSTKKI